MQFAHRIAIDVPPTRAWAQVIDLTALPAVTRTILAVEAHSDDTPVAGATATVSQAGFRPALWEVTRVEEPRLFEWHTRLGPLTYTAATVIEPTPGGCTQTLTVTLTGAGAAGASPAMRRQIRNNLESQNKAMKESAEKSGCAHQQPPTPD